MFKICVFLVDNIIDIQGKIKKEVKQSGDSVSIETNLWTGQTSNHSCRMEKKFLSSDVFRQTVRHIQPSIQWAFLPEV